MAQVARSRRPKTLDAVISRPFSPEALADHLAEGLRKALESRPLASLAVSGGRTPEAVFPILAEAKLPWERVWITLTDERWLSPDHEGSNEGLVRRLLLQDKAARAHFLGFWREGLTPEAALPDLERQLAHMPWPLDVLFLGMGPDGHIASLFPGEAGLKVKSGRVTTAQGPAPYPERVTLILPELARARWVALAAQGAEKQGVLTEGGADLPIQRFLAESNESVVVFG
ncbi:MAG: 6-phosphogluconolactonase [Alphaproteobacteria bacterium]|nr:6-phosphogluconolactonase [Alphaproteobacteria bacterium]